MYPTRPKSFGMIIYWMGISLQEVPDQRHILDPNPNQSSYHPPKSPSSQPDGTTAPNPQINTLNPPPRKSLPSKFQKPQNGIYFRGSQSFSTWCTRLQHIGDELYEQNFQNHWQGVSITGASKLSNPSDNVSALIMLCRIAIASYSECPKSGGICIIEFGLGLLMIDLMRLLMVVLHYSAPLAHKLISTYLQKPNGKPMTGEEEHYIPLNWQLICITDCSTACSSLLTEIWN